MKLLNCLDCHDVVLLYKRDRTCLCGKTTGRVANTPRQEAIFVGNARILGMRNPDYIMSINDKNTKMDYPWFVIQPQKS